ncbi:VCBS domain-containing protein [Agarivorans litoreus]|uniref:VCBS domain-containing protein n=1 Tax=Agarivorans litoreus TaxID=1510455 RepID=UPI001C7CBD4A|nr:VCBS domain-containing protein [Agarivorans litoreus]
MTKQQDKSSLKAKSKLTKSSNSVDKDKGIKKAKRIDEDVARLKAKELRDVKTAGLSNQDLVADKSHQQLLSEQQAIPDEGLLSEATNPSETISETGRGGESANAKSSESDDTSKAVAGAALVEAPLIDGSKATARVGKGGGSSANSHWFATHSLLNHVGVKGLTSNQLANVEGNHYKPSVTVQQLTKVNHSQTDQQQVPVIHAEGAQQQSGSVKEDKVSEVSGQLHVSGVDANQVSWAVESGNGVYGQLVVDSHTGQWRYQLDNTLDTTNALAEGEHHSEQFVVVVKDNLQHQIKMVVSIEVEGSNDKPQISGLHHANVTEMSALSEVDGQLFAKDPDHSEQLQWAVSHSQGQYGRLTINPDNGQWQYQLDNKQPATLALTEGQQGVEHFVVSVTDSAGEVVKQDLTIQVLGTNEQAIIGGGYSGVLTEDKDVHQGQLHADGVLTVTDVDSGQNQFQAGVLQGQFGTLSINNLGHWTYTADNSQTAIQGLKSGESVTDTLVVHSVDGTEQKITVTINGTDDKAVIGGTATASLTEDKDVHSGLLRVDGALTVTDVDAGENQFQATSLQGQFGTLSINNQGHWSYTADNSQPTIQGLKSGESLTDTLLVHSVDGTEQKITVTINGTDDKAVIAGTTTASLTEDKEVHSGLLRVDGVLTITDVDAGENQFQAEVLQGQFGTLSINNLGHWTYTADNSQPTVQGLKSGESLTDTLLVHSVDGTEQKITVTINGTDDKAQIAGASTANLTEDKEVHSDLLRVDGVLTITDVDTGENQFQAGVLQGQFGTLSINNLGHWIYTADNSQSSIQGLKTGESLTDTLLVHSVDGTEQKITVTINGTDDKAQIAGASTANLTEDKEVHNGLLRVDGALTITDADAGQNQFAATSFQGQFGTLSINELGHWTYTADNSQPTIQGLKSGESLTDTLLVHSVDGTEQKITVTINGTDDKAVIAGTSTASLTEDKDVHSGLLRVEGALTVTDPDAGQSQFAATTLQGQFGTLSINQLGHWTYTADNSQTAIQGLKTGESLTDTLLVHSVDGTEQKITVTINGTDDKAVIGGTATATLTEDKDLHSGQLRVDGGLTITDVDTGENQFQAGVLQGQFGTLSINNLGHWTYTADNSQTAIQGLKTGESLTDTLLVHSADGTEQQVTVTINGTDDKAQIAGASTANLTEDKEVHSGLLRVEGALTVTDPDAGQSQFAATTLQGQFGTLSINQLGHWTYTADNSQTAIQGLKTGESLTDTLLVHSADGTEQKITVMINGTDDKAVIGGTATASLTEDKDVHSGLLRVDGALTVSDVDAGENQFQATSLQGQFGTLSINNQGHWTYTADNSQTAIQGLKSGESLTDTLVVHSVDGTEQKITVTINGTDDKAVIAGTATASLTEEKEVHQGQLRVDGALTVTDADNGQAQFTATSLQGQFGTLSINELGHWTYTAENSQATIQGLKTGESLTDTLVVHSIDGTEQKITVTINGTDDKAQIAGASTANLTEDKEVHQGQLRVDGALTVTDVDTGENQFQAGVLQGQFGTLSINNLGHWTYTADNSQTAIQGLKSGESVTDTLLVHSVDGTEQQVTVTINGTDDKAQIAGASTANLTEDKEVHNGLLRVEGALTVTDPDAGQNQFAATTLQGQFGTLSINQLGHWTYTADNSQTVIQGLKTGESVTDTLVVHSIDGTEQKITVTINGSNDLPVISGVSSGNVIEQGENITGKANATGTLIATDLDSTDSIQWAISQPQGQFGNLSIDQQGNWRYQLDNSTGGTTDKLAAGQQQQETFWVTATDSSGVAIPHKVVVDVTGSNDKPIVTAWAQLAAGTEDKPVIIQIADLLRHASDIDTTDTLRVENLQASHGHLINNNDGSYTFTPDKDFNGEVRLSYNVVDGQGGSVSTQAKFDLAASPDNAVITDAQTNPNLRGVTEDRGYIDTHYKLNYNGQLNIQDPDAGEAKFDPNIGPQTNQGIGYDTKLGGHVVLMQNGHYTYTLDNRNIQHLAEGEAIKDSVVIRSADGTTHTIEMTVHGTNDRPTIAAQSHTVIEGGALIYGQMRGQDIDTGATLHYSTPKIDGLIFNTDGSYSFDPSNSSYQSLASGVTKNLTIPVTVTDEHNASSTQNLTISITGVNNAAVIGGVDIGSVTENSAGKDMSPDYAQPGMAHLGRNPLYASGTLTISDLDSGEAAFNTHGVGFTYSGKFGDLLLQENGQWSYYADAGGVRIKGGYASHRGSTIDQLGEGQSLTDTITVYSKDGTSHDIVITIHGSNDRPYCSSEVQLNAGTEDTRQTITVAQLLQNTVDVDKNDAGLLSIENLRADHGSIKHNQDGSFTFTPEKDYNGAVHFSYDVKDAHGGITHTNASTTLAAVNDNPDVTPLTDSVTEGTDNHHSLNLLLGATDKEGDALTISHLEYAIDGQPQSGQLPTGITLGADGHTLIVDSTDAAFNHLANGQSQKVAITYQVEDGHGGSTQQTATLTIVGTDDKATLVSNVIQLTETQAIDSQFTTYKGNLQLIDPDSGDHTQFSQFSGTYLGQGFEPGHLNIWPDGSYQFMLNAGTNRHADDLISSLHAGESMEIPYEFITSDGQKLTIMVKVIGEDDKAKIEVGKYSSFNENAYEDKLSPGSTPNQVRAGGTLQVIDPDHDQAGFIAQNITTADGGHFNINAQGHWAYTIDNDKLQHLGAGESYQKIFNVESIDGSAHKDITVTVHGTNDAPVATAEVRLANGLEDSKIVLTSAQLLANTTDIDDNDIGKLSIENLQADHGAIALNTDGTFTFTPEKDYNGEVHFTYNVKDAHGGITHTGASINLAAVDDKTVFGGVTTDSVKEDIDPGANSYGNFGGSRFAGTQWHQLTITDTDSKVDQIDIEFGGKTVTWQVGSPLDIQTNYGKFELTTYSHGPHKGELVWLYNGDNRNPSIQGLKEGESLHESITLVAPDGTRQALSVEIKGTEDHVIIDAPNHLGDVIEHQSTGAQVSGQLQAHDSDTHDSVSWAITQTAGKYGEFSVDTDGHWHYVVDEAKAGALGQGDEWNEHFTIESLSTDGSKVSKTVTVVVHGSNDAPTVTSGLVLTQGSEDKQVILTQQDLLAHASDSDRNDQGWLSATHLTADHGTISTNADGSFTFTPEKDFNGDVHFSYDVTDRHGGVTHTSASTTLMAVNDAAHINGQSQASSNVNIFEDSATNRLTGLLALTDVDSGEANFVPQAHLLGQYGEINLEADGHWAYSLNNNLAATNALKAGQMVTDSFTFSSPDGTASHTINIQVHGHDDRPSLSLNEGEAQQSLDLFGGLNATGVRKLQFSTDGIHFSNRVPDGFMLARDGHTLQVDPAHNSYNHLANGIASTIDIKYQLQQSAGSNLQASQQQARVVITGTSDKPIIHSFSPHSPQNNGPVTGNLLQGATDVDDGAHLELHDVQYKDPVTQHYVTVQAGQTHNISGVGMIAISANGDYSFTPNNSFSGQVPSLIYRVTDTHGDYADNSQNTLSIHIDPYQPPFIAPLTVALANDTGSSATDLVTQDGTLSISGQTAGMQVEYSIDGGKNWTTQFSPIEGVNQLQVRQTDGAGHASAASSLSFTLDTQSPSPHISLDPVTADNVLNQTELSANLAVTGTVSSEVNVGDKVTLTLGARTYTGAVDANHQFSIDVPADQLGSHTNIMASITITDEAGNSATATDNHHYSIDTGASIRVNPISGDNIIEASEHHQAIDIAGTVSGVEDGQVVTVSIGGHHYQAVVAHGAWSTSLTAVEVQALPGGTVDVTASVHDLAGNLASIHSPLFVGDSANPVPSLSFKAPPTPTGGGSIGSHISGDLVVPPLIQQLTPNLPSGGWAITDGKGHTSTSLHGQYGTLTIDPDTGHVDYVYSQAPTPGNKAAGGSHWAGQTVSEEHHDVFQVVYHDAHASNVDVKVNLDVTYVHGHSGHNQTSTHLVAMTVTPDTSVAMPPAADMHDAPDDIMAFSASITEDESSFDHVVSDIGAADESTPHQSVHLDPLNQSEASSPIDHYLQMVGVSHADITPASEVPLTTDLPDMAATQINQDEELFDSQPIDAFENPLDEDKHEQHKLNEQVIHDDTLVQHQVNQDNDDDLLHQALNDMHNQW